MRINFTNYGADFINYGNRHDVLRHTGTAKRHCKEIASEPSQ